MEKSLTKNRDHERGAALVVVVLISFLLLAACGAILISSSQLTVGTSDAVTEQQAYYAAESGLQATLNVMRGNVTPNQTLPGNQSQKIDYRKAVDLLTSNYNNDPSGSARLSRWLDYNYTPPDSTAPDRVTSDANYAPINGTAYSVSVSDPDNTNQLSVTPSGCFPNGGGTINFGSSQFIFSAASQTNVTATNGSVNVSLGSFRVTGNVNVNVLNDERINVCLTVSKPFPTTVKLSGWLRKGIITGSSLSTTAKIEFDSKIFTAEDTKFVLGSRFLSILNNNAQSALNVTVNPPQPKRLLVRSTGYAPRGGRKVLEMIIRNNNFGTLTAPSTVNLIGISTNFSFATGNSQNVTYRGDDACDPSNDTAVPAFGVTNDVNLAATRNGIGSKPDLTRSVTAKAERDETVQNVLAELPDWIKTTESLDATIKELRSIAKAKGRYFASGAAPNSLGNYNDMKGVTFIDGDASLSQAGGGILVVTGQLTFNGGFDFKGVVIVTGTEGLRRNGGGNGTIEGFVFVAPYNPNNVAAGFLSPKFDTNGGGNSTMRYNSCAAMGGLSSIGTLLAGVAEK